MEYSLGMRTTTSSAERQRSERALRSRYAYVREREVERLGSCETTEAFERLTNCIADMNAGVRARVAESLQHYPRRGVTGPLLTLLEDSDDIVRINAAESLGLLRVRTAVGPLIRVMRRDPEPLARGYAAEALSRIGARRVIDAIEKQLATETSSAAGVRMVTALHKLGQRKRWRELLKFVDDSDYRVRCAVAVALADIASPTTRRPIRRAIRNRLKVEDTVAAKERFAEVLESL